MKYKHLKFEFLLPKRPLSVNENFYFACDHYTIGRKINSRLVKKNSFISEMNLEALLNIQENPRKLPFSLGYVVTYITVCPLPFL